MWGAGFTEWTNVTKAKPLFKWHNQPFLPADLGFYDLRLHQVREQQAILAKNAGIEGFCYWHYWFGAGKRVLETVFDSVLSSGTPNFPFCLGWANESWTGKWHGLDNEYIFKQTYPGNEDHVAHFYAILQALKDSRYIRVKGQPLFVIYRPDLIPSITEFVFTWTRLAVENGFPGFYFVSNRGNLFPLENTGISKFMRNAPTAFIEAWASSNSGRAEKLLSNVLNKLRISNFSQSIHKPLCAPYKAYVENQITQSLLPYEIPLIVPNWDNTPRCGLRGCVLTEPSPRQFETLVRDAINKVSTHDPEEQLIFIKSWNEWAEGNTLEPSLQFRHQFLVALKNAVEA